MVEDHKASITRQLTIAWHCRAAGQRIIFFIAGGWYQPVSTDTGPTCITHLVPRGWLVKPVIHHCRVAGSFIIRQARPAGPTDDSQSLKPSSDNTDNDTNSRLDGVRTLMCCNTQFFNKNIYYVHASEQYCNSTHVHIEEE